MARGNKNKEVKLTCHQRYACLSNGICFYSNIFIVFPDKSTYFQSK